jgi:hypothetical protein
MAIRDQHFTATHNPAAINGSARKLHCKSKVIEIDEDDDDESGGEYAKDFRTFLLTRPELAHLKLILQLRCPRLGKRFLHPYPRYPSSHEPTSPKACLEIRTFAGVSRKF